MTNIQLRDYQQDAVKAWETNSHRGILQMATGTGKTYTAIGAFDRLYNQQESPLLVIVSVPYTHLAQQWAVSFSEWGYDSVAQLYGSRTRNWKSELSRLISDLQIGLRSHEIVITTHATMAEEYFRNSIADLDADSLLIADEVHGLGSEHQRRGLVEAHDFRLGLSATPRRYFDEEGTEFLLEYFNDIVFEFTLADAIPEYLVEYDYHPRIVEMTPDELKEYRSFSQQLASAVNQEEPDEELIQRLRIKRSKIVKSATQKYRELRSILDELGEPDHLLIYTNHKQIDRVQNICTERSIKQHRFTAEESDDERARLLEQFSQGHLDALVAMRCLDEGVDVPSTRQAIMMSNSGNRMQFVQRRGRVLRHAPGKDHATIYDLIVVPTLDPDRTLLQSERTIMETEIRRFEEFAETARNEKQARSVIEPVRNAYNL